MDKVNEEALKSLEKYKAEGAHMLIPCMAQIQDVMQNFRLMVTPTVIPSHPKEGYVYCSDTDVWDEKKKEWKAKTTGGEVVIFHAQAYQKLAADANIMWSRPIITADKDYPTRKYCEIVGEILLPDGFSKYRLPDGAGMDTEMERAALIAKNSFNGKFDEKKQWLVDRDLLRVQRKQDQLIITNAKNRVTQRILGLKNNYTLDELKRPFISVRVVYWPDMTDKFTRELFIKGQVAQRFITGIYGADAAEQIQPAITYRGEVPLDKCQPTDPNVIDADSSPTGNGKPYHLDPKALLPADDEPPFASSGPSPESLRADFAASNTDGQCYTLRSIAGEAGRNLDAELKATKKTLEGCSAAYRLKLYDYLTGWGKEKAA